MTMNNLFCYRLLFGRILRFSGGSSSFLHDTAISFDFYDRHAVGAAPERSLYIVAQTVLKCKNGMRKSSYGTKLRAKIVTFAQDAICSYLRAFFRLFPRV